MFLIETVAISWKWQFGRSIDVHLFEEYLLFEQFQLNSSCLCFSWVFQWMRQLEGSLRCGCVLMATGQAPSGRSLWVFNSDWVWLRFYCLATDLYLRITHVTTSLAWRNVTEAHQPGHYLIKFICVAQLDSSATRWKPILIQDSPMRSGLLVCS